MSHPVFDSYFSTLTESQKLSLEHIEKIVKTLVPEANEVISYGIPGFKYQGAYLLGFAAFKNHFSLFPTSGPIDALKPKLKAYKLARGTIQFTDSAPIPDSLIKEIINHRLSVINKE